jgi:phosphoribosylcarboxyaminoimidazole (NCAIR) mutase
VDDDKAAFGELFTPALKVVVDETTATLKHLGAWFVENRADISEWGQDFASVVNVSLGAAKEGMEVFLAVAGTAPDVLGAIADNTDLVVVALTAMTGAQVVNGVGALVGSLAELKAAAVAAQGAILAANAASAAGGLAAGAAALGAGTTFALATATGGAFYMATKSAMQGIQSLTGLELDGGKAAYEEALARDAEATKRLDAAMKKRAEYEEQKKAWDGKFQVAIKQYQEQEEAQRKLESKLADERRALADAEMRDNLARTRREGELQMAALDAGYSQGLVGTRAYYDARLGIIQDAADAELAYIAQRQGEVQALLDNEKDP